jgi:soluble lytic murein transglycosylase
VLGRREGAKELAKQAGARLDGGLGLLAGKPLRPLTLPPLPRAPEGLWRVKALLRLGRRGWARGEARVRFFARQGEGKRAWGWVLFALGDPHTAARAGGRLSWSTPYRAAVLAASQRYGLEPALLFAVMRVESAFNASALSSTGAKGLFQFTDATWRMLAGQLGEVGADPFDPEKSALFAAAYLRQLRDAFGGDLRLAVVAYNGGPGYVRRALQVYPDFWDFLRFQPRDEPREYLAKVWRAYAIYRALGGAAFMRPAFLEGLPRPR